MDIGYILSKKSLGSASYLQYLQLKPEKIYRNEIGRSRGGNLVCDKPRAYNIPIKTHDNIYLMDETLVIRELRFRNDANITPVKINTINDILLIIVNSRKQS